MRKRFTYQQALFLEQHAQVPSRTAVGGRLVNDAGIEKTLAADNLEDGRLEVEEALAENLTKTLSVLNHLLLLNQLQGANGNGAAQRVAAVRGTVCARLDDHHDLLAAKDCADRVHATGNGLAEGDHVGLDAGPFGAQHLTGAANTSLDFVGNEQHIVLGAERLHLGQIVLVGNHDTSLALDGLDDESGSVLAVGIEYLFDIGDIVVSNGLAGGGRRSANVGNIRTVVVLGLGVGREGNGSHLLACVSFKLIPDSWSKNTYCAAVEVFGNGKDESLALLNTLDLVCPFAGNLDGGLGGFGASVHRQHHVVSKDSAHLLRPLGEDIVVEGAGAQRETRSLLGESLDELGVAVPLVDGAVGR